jgi:hypothetical protein
MKSQENPMSIAPFLISGGVNLLSSLFNRNASGRAADQRASSSREAAQLEARTAREALDFTKGQSRWLREQSEADREANFNQWLADQKNVELQGWDTSVNQRGEITAGRRNIYDQGIAQGRNLYDRWEGQQQRLGNIGQLTGAAPRQIAGLHEAPYTEMDPLQRTERTYPGYVPGSTEIPPDPAIEAMTEERRRSTALADLALREAAARNGVSPEEYRAWQGTEEYDRLLGARG